MAPIRRFMSSAAALVMSAACSTAEPGSPPEAGQRVVFVCEHGAAKSVVAAAHFNRLARDRRLPHHAVAKGADPQHELAPSTVKGLAAEGIEPLPATPERLTEEDFAGAARVVSFGCDLSKVAPPGASVEAWDDVPAVGDGYDAARACILERVERLLDELGRAGR